MATGTPGPPESELRASQAPRQAPWSCSLTTGDPGPTGPPEGPACPRALASPQRQALKRRHFLPQAHPAPGADRGQAAQTPPPAPSLK